jgi:two-component system, OmpR family, response regulator
VPMPKLLLIEDDAETASEITAEMIDRGFQVDWAASGIEGLDKARSVDPDVMIVDRLLPGMDGLTIVEALRNEDVNTPVLVLSALGNIDDRVRGLRAGGDDYLTKPFSLAELTARLRALLNRAGLSETVEAAGLSLDPTTFEVSCGERRVRVTPTEFRLLGALAAQSERTVARRELVRAAWPQGAVVHDNTIDVYLARLRRKLRDLPGAPAIRTVHGVGYRLQ